MDAQRERPGVLVMSNQRSIFWSWVLISLTATAAAIAQTVPARGRGTPATTTPERTRGLTINSDFLQLPLVRGGRGSFVRFTLEVDGKAQRSVNVAFAKEG